MFMEMNINNHIVIMAGGIGSRFWPMSSKELPKQTWMRTYSDSTNRRQI